MRVRILITDNSGALARNRTLITGLQNQCNKAVIRQEQYLVGRPRFELGIPAKGDGFTIRWLNRSPNTPNNYSGTPGET